MRLKVSSAKRRPFCLGLNVLSVYCGCGGESPSNRNARKDESVETGDEYIESRG